MRHYQKKLLEDGTPNPRFKPDTRSGDRHLGKHKPGTSGKSLTKFARASFIAWDGEGINLDSGEQVYALLCSSHGEVEIDPSGLSTERCLETITNVSRETHLSIHVCYGASYDVNMMLRDVPYTDLEKLHKGETIHFGLYELEYRPRKSFIIRKNFEDPKKKWRKRSNGSMEKRYDTAVTLWDVIGFFQSKFVKALETYFPGDDEIAMAIEKVESGKVRRGSFREEEIRDFVLPYCQLEVTLLEKLMKRLASHLQEAQLEIVRWDGAGACAAALLKRENIKQHKQDSPDTVQLAAQHAYAGGRIEPLLYGHTNETVYHYDINSAYPAAMLELPSLAGGYWKHIAHVSMFHVKHLPAFSLYKISWKFRAELPAYPFPYRLKSGAILFPQAGKNWIWGPEVLAAFDTVPYASEDIVIEEVWTFVPQSAVKPFGFLPGLFDLRRKWKDENNGAEKALKLAINSVYGKLVQQLGYADTRKANNTSKPPYHQLEWGGYITASTRAKLYRAVMQAPDQIIAMATDGIFSRVPLDLPCSKRLGEWDYSEHTSLTLVTSGVYWYTNPDGQEKAFYRGFDQGTLTRENVLLSWGNLEREYFQYENGKPVAKGAPSTRFITLGAVILVQPGVKVETKEKRFKKWRTWEELRRDLSLDMTSVSKRMDVPCETSPHEGLVETRARTPEIFQLLSLPFPDELEETSILSKKYNLLWDSPNEQEVIANLPAFEYLAEYDNINS